MKSLNKTSDLWTTLSTSTLNGADYQAACCLNIKVNSLPNRDPQIRIDSQDVPLDVLREIVQKADAAKTSGTKTDHNVAIDPKL